VISPKLCDSQAAYVPSTLAVLERHDRQDIMCGCVKCSALLQLHSRLGSEWLCSAPGTEDEDSYRCYATATRDGS